VGGLLLDHYGWRFLFMSTGLGACLWLLPWFSIARASNLRTDAQPSTPPRTAISWKQFFGLRVTWAITIGSFFYAYYWYFCLTWLPSYFVMARGFSFVKMGAFTAAPLMVMAIITPLSGRGADILIAGARSPVIVRKKFVCCGFLLGSSVIAVLAARNSAALMVILVLSFCGLGLASANFWALTQTLCPSAVVGTVIGYQNAVANLAGVSAPIITGWLITNSKSFTLAIIFAGMSLLIAAGIFMFFIREADLSIIHQHVD
jgi:ACS family D-galactonate transporter-like MFS transporter